MWQHVDRWGYPYTDVQLSAGPEWVATEPAPDGFTPNPLLGFTKPVSQSEPLTWEGDGA